MIPKYVTLSNQLKEEILSGKYLLGEKLPTENELAEKYNYSRQTVRSALNILVEDNIIEKRQGSGNTIISTGYQSKSNIVALLIPRDDVDHYQAIIDDINSVLFRENLYIEIMITGNLITKEKEYLENILINNYAGIIVEPCKSALPNPNIALYQKILRRSPVIFLYASYKELYNSVFVGGDYYQVGYQLTRHLINRGHKNIIGIFKGDDIPGSQKYSGMIEALLDSKLPIYEENILFYSTHQLSQIISNNDYSLFETFIKNAIGKASGIVCYNDEIASILINICQAMGIDVPGQLSIVGNDNNSFATSGSISITTIGFSRSLGREAAKLFISAKKGEAVKSTLLPYNMYERESSSFNQ